MQKLINLFLIFSILLILFSCETLSDFFSLDDNNKETKKNTSSQRSLPRYTAQEYFRAYNQPLYKNLAHNRILNHNKVFTKPKPKPKAFIIEGRTISKSDTNISKLVYWNCKDSIYNDFDDKVLLQIGYYKESILPEKFGFIIFNDEESGIHINYRRDGINHRWNWETDENGNYDYSFIIEPDGTGRFYNFTGVPDGERIKPSSFYKCYRQ